MIGKKSFTLVELLIVIIIVGILVVASISIITTNVEKAKWAEAIQTLGAIKSTLRLYNTEFGDYPSTTYYLNGPYKNCPPSLDIDIANPNAEGRYIYVTRPKSAYPLCAYVFHDQNNNGTWNDPEPYIYIYINGGFYSYNAPEF